MALLDWIDKLNTAIGKLVGYLIWAGIALIVLEVTLRYVFNAPTVWGPGYAQRVFGAYFVLVGGYTLIKDGHVRVDVLLHTRSKRLTALLDVLNYAVLIIWAGALVYEGWYYFHDSWAFAETDDSALGHPLWPVKLALFVGVLLILLQAVAEIIRGLVRFVRPDLLPRPETEGVTT